MCGGSFGVRVALALAIGALVLAFVLAAGSVAGFSPPPQAAAAKKRIDADTLMRGDWSSARSLMQEDRRWASRRR